MPKGRQFVPSTEGVGVWFQHRGTDDGRPLFREKSTTTGDVLSYPFQSGTCKYPPDPPSAFKAKDAKLFKSSNKFSEHEHRESLRNDGEIFGMLGQPRSIGKKLLSDPEQDIHHSEHDFLAHYDRHHVTVQDYNSVYSDAYRGCPSGLAPTCRRFPRRYPDPLPGVQPPGKTMSCVLNESAVEKPCSETIGLMALTQRPPDHNCTWKYSYRGLPRCYPTGYSHADATHPYCCRSLKEPPPTTLPVVNRTASCISAA